MAALAGWGLINHHPPGPRPGSRRACLLLIFLFFIILPGIDHLIIFLLIILLTILHLIILFLFFLFTALPFLIAPSVSFSLAYSIALYAYSYFLFSLHLSISLSSSFLFSLASSISLFSSLLFSLSLWPPPSLYPLIILYGLLLLPSNPEEKETMVRRPMEHLFHSPTLFGSTQGPSTHLWSNLGLNRSKA